MNPFNVGDEVVLKTGRPNVITGGVVTSISPCKIFLRFKGQKFGYDFRNYEMVKPLEIFSYEEML